MTAPKPLPRVDYPDRRDPAARAAYAAGLRHLADVIEADPDCPLPSGPLALFIHEEDQAAIAARLRAALGGGRWEKKEAGGGARLTLDGMCGGLPIDIWLDRDAVCERVVVGVETVEVPAQPAQPAMPARTETREVVEWRCGSLLAAAADDVDTEAVPA